MLAVLLLREVHSLVSMSCRNYVVDLLCADRSVLFLVRLLWTGVDLVSVSVLFACLRVTE